MVRAPLKKSKPIGRPPAGRATAAKMSALKQRPAAKSPNVTSSVSKEDLRSRVEKLERANATLRVKNKDLRIIAVQAAEQVDALTLQLANSERRAGRQARSEAPAEASETTRQGRGKRKTRGVVANGHEEEDMSGNGHPSWGSRDRVDA